MRLMIYLISIVEISTHLIVIMIFHSLNNLNHSDERDDLKRELSRLPRKQVSIIETKIDSSLPQKRQTSKNYSKRLKNAPTIVVSQYTGSPLKTEKKKQFSTQFKTMNRLSTNQAVCSEDLEFSSKAKLQSSSLLSHLRGEGKGVGSSKLHLPEGLEDWDQVSSSSVMQKDLDELNNLKMKKRSKNARLAARSLKMMIKYLRKKRKNKYLIVNYKTDLEKPNLKRLDYFLKKYYINDTKNGFSRKYSLKQTLCDLKIGSVFFCKKKQETVFDKYGSGIALYFIMLKTLIIFMTIAGLASFYLIWTNIKSYYHLEAIRMHNLSFGAIFQRFFYASSLASLGEKTIKSAVFLVDSSPKNITFRCETGYLTTNLNRTSFGLVDHYRGVGEVENIFDTSCTNFSTFLWSIQKCDKLRSCEVQYSPDWLEKSCWKQLSVNSLNSSSKLEKTDAKNSSKAGFLKLECLNARAFSESSLDSISDSYKTYQSVCFFLIYLFQAFVAWLWLNEKFFTKQYNLTNRVPSEYALELLNYPKDMNEEQLCKHILRIFDKFSQKYNFSANPIIDLEVTRTKSYLSDVELLQKMNHRLEKYLVLYQELSESLSGSEKNTPQATAHLDVYRQEDRLINKIVRCEETQKEVFYRKKLKILHRIEDQQKAINRLKQKIYLSQKNHSSIGCVFVTFQRIKDRQFFLNLLSFDFDHFLASCSKARREKLEKEGRLIYSRSPPLPQNIKWKNYSFRTGDKFLRRLCSWSLFFVLYSVRKANSIYFELFRLFLIIFIVFCGFIHFLIFLAIWILIQTSNIKDQMRSRLPSCTFSTAFMELDEVIGLINSKGFGVDQMRCFCLQDFDGYHLKQRKDQNFCNHISSTVNNINRVLTFESIIVTILTIIFDEFYKWLASFEVYNERNKKKLSFIIKLFLWKYLMVCLIPVISSLYLYHSGRFDEFTAKWYHQKGVGLQLVTVIRVFSLAGVGVARFLIPKLIQLYDTKFTKDRSKTRKTTYKEYQEVYTNMKFDPELSYSEICTSLFMLMTYGFSMPVMFVATWLQLVTIFLRDKLLVTSTYIFYSYVDQKLHVFSRRLLMLLFLLGTLSASWLFNNDSHFSKQALPGDFGNQGVRIERIVLAENSTHQEVQFRVINQTILNKTHNVSSELAYLANNGEKINLRDLLHIKASRKGYGSLLNERLSRVFLSDFSGLTILTVALIAIVWAFFNQIRTRIAKLRLKKGIKNFEGNFPKVQFEDLVQEREVIERANLRQKTKGRRTAVKGLIKIHEERFKRLIRNWRRGTKKKQSRLEKEKAIKEGRKGLMKKSTLDHILFKNSLLKGKSGLSLEGLKKSSTLSGGRIGFNRKFSILSSYDFRFHPIYREYFIGEIDPQALEKIDDIEDEEYVMAKKGMSKSFLGFLSVQDEKSVG